jgi:hypothetical protein
MLGSEHFCRWDNMYGWDAGEWDAGDWDAGDWDAGGMLGTEHFCRWGNMYPRGEQLAVDREMGRRCWEMLVGDAGEMLGGDAGDRALLQMGQHVPARRAVGGRP